jgi:hypothetical protein
MEEYLETLGTYYDEKVRFLSDVVSEREGKLKCDDCDNKKLFDESDPEKFLFTCGSEKSGVCGTQITIEFPKYVCYEKELRKLKDKLEEGINWSVISKHLDIDNELKQQNEKKEKCLLAIQYIEELFNETNMNDKKEKIQKFYDTRIEQSRKCKSLIKDLEKEKDELKKTRIRNEYVRNMKNMNNDYDDIKLLINNINPYLQTELPKVTIHNKNFEKKITKEKKKKKDSPEKPKKKKDSPEKPKKKKDSPEKPKKKKDSPEKFKISEFKKDVRVSWFAKGQDNFGIVREDFTEESKNIAIKDDNGKNKKIPYSRLTIVKGPEAEGPKEDEEGIEPEPEQQDDKEPEQQDDKEPDDKEQDDKEPEQQDDKEPEQQDDKEPDDKEDPGENIVVPKSVDDLKEGLKIVANYQGQEFNGNIGKVDKRMKKKANVTLYPDEGGEMSVKIPISDIIKIIL